MFFTILFITLIVATASSEGLDCIHRDYGQGGTVCVCNSTYCDDSEPLQLFPPRQYYLYTSSKDGMRFNKLKKNFAQKFRTRSLTFTLNVDAEYQTVEGFGGAFTDSAGINIASLSPASQDNLLRAYFSPRGNNYTLGRVPIAGSDFSTRPYTYDDHAFDDGLLKFNLTDEDFKYKVPYILKALELSNGSLRLMAAAWTAPPWMKTNDDFSGMGFLKDVYYRTWSNYLIKFLEEYDKLGIQIWSLSTGNEPINGGIPFFPFNCMGWTPQTQGTWVSEHMGPVLSKSPFNQTHILALDDQRFQLPWWLSIMFRKNKAASYISGIGVHWYWNHIAPLVLLDKTHEAYPDKFIISTEACYTKQIWEKNVVHLGAWSRGEEYAENIIDDMTHWVSGWVDWNLALDETGGPNWVGNVVDSAVIINATADEFYKQPMFYAIGHFSKFVPPGSKRIGFTGGNRNVKGVAFHTPHHLIVVVLLNKRNADQAITITGAPRGLASFILPAKSIVTFVCRDKKMPLSMTIDDWDT